MTDLTAPLLAPPTPPAHDRPASFTVTPHLNATDPYGNPVTWSLGDVTVNVGRASVAVPNTGLTAGGVYDVPVYGQSTRGDPAAAPVVLHVADCDADVLQPLSNTVTLDADGHGLLRVRAIKPGLANLVLADAAGDAGGNLFGVGYVRVGADPGGGEPVVGGGAAAPAAGPWFAFVMPTPPVVPVTVGYSLAGSTADPALYSGLSGTVTFPAGVSYVTVPVGLDYGYAKVSAEQTITVTIDGQLNDAGGLIQASLNVMDQATPTVAIQSVDGGGAGSPDVQGSVFAEASATNDAAQAATPITINSGSDKVDIPVDPEEDNSKLVRVSLKPKAFGKVVSTSLIWDPTQDVIWPTAQVGMLAGETMPTPPRFFGMGWCSSACHDPEPPARDNCQSGTQMKISRCFLLACCVVCIVTAVVDTAGAAETVSLAGDWRFEVADAKAAAYTRNLSGTIHLPGTMDEAGLGPKNMKPPTLEGPYRLRNYAGPAWYQRDIEIPAGWQGKRVTLLLERCRWVTTVWLDDRRIQSADSLIAPHLVDFGAGVAPGRHRLTICVDNSVKIDLGTFVSALFGGTWGNMNGIVGRIELSATPPVWIDDVQVYPDVAHMSARVAVRIGNATGQAGHGQLTVGRRTADQNWGPEGGAANVVVDMAGAKLWDEFSPNMSELTVQLDEDKRTVRFGMRDFARRGTQFTMNGRPLFLRGTLECSVWPLTGYPPTDVAAWQRIFQVQKSYGLNFVRFHSWCPPEAAFEAADREGMMIQAEGPMANVDAGSDPTRDAFLEEELKREVDTYGNHPSFCLMTLGNEFGGKAAVLTRWVDLLMRRDARHLYSSASAGQTTPNRQWTETPSGRGIRGPATERDLRNIVAGQKTPIVGHEIGQWMYWPDFTEIKRWSGVMALKNFEMIRDDMGQKRLLDEEPEFVQASGRFATLLYKEECEVLLRTPGYGGFSLLGLSDYPTQGTALIGPLDAFWDSKGFITPAAWRKFCSPTVLLLRKPKSTYSNGEPFVATADVAHFGPADLPAVEPVWAISDERGREIAGGKFPSLSAPTGKLTSLGEIRVSLANVSTPARYTVTLSIPGTAISNDWSIWIYPEIPQPLPPVNSVVCENWADTTAALAAGKKVIFFPLTSNPKQTLRGSFLPVFWSPVWFPSQKPNTMGLLCDPTNPIFGRFPTEMNSDWQWYKLVQRSRVFVLDDTPAGFRPLVQVIDNFARNHRLGVVFEGRVGGGRLLVCGLNLTDAASDPAVRQWLASLYDYVGSEKFDPGTTLDAGWLGCLFDPSSANRLRSLGAKIHADSEASATYGATQAIDGDPDTFWHTPWDKSAPTFPHSLVVELPKPVEFSGITCLPRQDGNRNGLIKDYAVFISADGLDWTKPVAVGTFTRTAKLQTVRFPHPVESRFLKLVANSSFDAEPYASLAELDLVPLEK